MPSLRDCIKLWSQEPLDITEAKSYQLVLDAAKPETFNLSDAESFHINIAVDENDQTTGFEYKFNLVLFSPTGFNVNEDKLQRAISRMAIHIMIELLPSDAYSELFENIEEISQFYTEREAIKLLDKKEVSTYPIEIVEKTTRKPFVIEE